MLNVANIHVVIVVVAGGGGCDRQFALEEIESNPCRLIVTVAIKPSGMFMGRLINLQITLRWRSRIFVLFFCLIGNLSLDHVTHGTWRNTFFFFLFSFFSFFCVLSMFLWRYAVNFSAVQEFSDFVPKFAVISLGCKIAIAASESWWFRVCFGGTFVFLWKRTDI